MTLGIFRPLDKMRSVRAGFRLPILMYHSIAAEAQPGVSPYYQTTTSPAVFEQQLVWLNEAGYRSATLPEALRLLQDPPAESERVVLITFDDGFRDFREAAFPALKRQGFTATMYLPTAFIGESRRSFKGRECLVWDEVRELRAQGISFGAHTVNHPVLHAQTWREIEAELAPAREQIEKALGEEVTGMAYPYAYPREDRPFIETFAQKLRAAGYQSCATTMVGRARSRDDAFSLKRLPVNSCDDRALFLAKLEGSYDWLSVPQGAFRRAKGWAGRTPAHANR